jgi:hypothetical protein
VPSCRKVKASSQVVVGSLIVSLGGVRKTGI